MPLGGDGETPVLDCQLLDQLLFVLDKTIFILASTVTPE